jgi:threonine-phosphate decarboxylase
MKRMDVMNSEHGGNLFSIARSLGLAPEELTDFSASINPLGPAPALRGALAEAFDLLGHYPESDATELRAALADYHRLTPANICVANGSTELIYLLPQLFPAARALLVAPPFSEYARALERAGWQVDYFYLDEADDFALHLDRLSDVLQGGYRLLMLANPGNPTGRLYAQSEILDLVGCCRRSNTFLVIDEAFMDFCEGDSAKELVSSHATALILRSMTKFFALPGIRLGYAIGAPAVISRIAELRQPWSVNTLAQVAGLVSLSDAEYIAATRGYVKWTREKLAADLATIKGLKVYPAAANYLLLRLTSGSTASELARQLLGERLIIRDCSNFAGLDNSFFRLAVRSEVENQRLAEAIRKIMS